MFILLLLFFKSVCLFCQRLVLHIHDRWINPKNVRLFKEAVETKGTKAAIEEYRQQGKPKPKRRRYTSSNTSNSSTLSHSLADSENCRFCANTPQGYCRHHFHLQELQVQKQQQQRNWCPLTSGGSTNRSTERRQLRKIKRELKQNIQQQQQKSSKASSYNPAIYDYNNTSYNSVYSPPASASYESNSINSFNDSGYQSVSVTASASASSTLDSEHSDLLSYSKQSSELASSPTSPLFEADYVEINLPSAPSSPSVVETTYSFETCYESPSLPPPGSSSPNLTKATSFNSFMSCEYSEISTSYL